LNYRFVLTDSRAKALVDRRGTIFASGSTPQARLGRPKAAVHVHASLRLTTERFLA
jgi:hypothetical protein